MAQSRRNPSESGFTLIEVLVAIPTGILAAIALPIFLSLTARAAKAPLLVVIRVP
jgi:type II secretory pathway pseudopilin PulG